MTFREFLNESAGVFFIRFGDWHPSETSRNYAIGDTEIGVSVFEAVKEGGKYRILLDDKHDPDSRQADTYWAWIAKFREDKEYERDLDPIYIVTGDVVGTGYDGEPLLKRLKVISQLNVEDLGKPKM